MKKFISAVSAAVVMFSSLAAADPANNQTEAADDMIKIMCVGDSITDGYTNDYVGSYRKFIYHNLTEMGYSVDMVGSKGGGWTPTYTDSETGESFEFDNDNTGYSGYSIVNYGGRTGIYETLQSTNCLASEIPDIVTLQIGTNDVIDNYEIDSAGERLEVLVDYILANIPDSSALFVTTIPNLDPNRSDVYSWFGNYRHSSDWQTQYTDEQAEQFVSEAVANYNAQVKQLVEAKRAGGASIYFADVNSAVTDVKTQLFDGVHPNNTGYKAMGAYWTDILKNYIENGSFTEPPKPVVTTTETPVTTTSTTTVNATTSTTAASTTINDTPSEIILGDVNFDGVVTEDDAELVLEYYKKVSAGLPGNLSAAQMIAADVNRDGIITPDDAARIREITSQNAETTTVQTVTTVTTTAVTTTTVPDVSDDKFTVSDLVKMSRYLLGYTYDIEYTADELKKYDIDSDGRVDVYDLILGRKLLCSTGEKVRAKFGSDYSLFENGEDNLVTPKDMNAESEKVTSGSTGSSIKMERYGAVLDDVTFGEALN